MTDKAVRRPSLVKTLSLVLALVGCVGAGFGAAFGVKLAFFSPTSVEEADDDHPPDDHAQPPNFERLNVAVRSGNYTAGLKIARQLTHDADHGQIDPQVQYALALCLEGQGRWDDALEAYKALGADAPAGRKAVAACGEVRCHLAEGHTAEATGALGRAERVSGVPGLSTELAYLRGRLALHAMPESKAGPFAPDRPLGVEPSLPPADYIDWLQLPTSAAAEASVPPTTSASAPPAAALAAFTAVLAADPSHPDDSAVRLAVANLRFASGELEEAAREYKRVREAHPPKPLLVAAAYNLGLIRHRYREWALARQLFTDAADLGVQTPAAAVAWWWVGRTELDAGNEDACRAAWERADQTDDREMTSAVLLGRVFLMLLDGQEERASKVFHGARLANVDPMPAVGEAFRRHFRLTDHPTRLKREELAAAVRQADYGSPLGPAGRLVFGGWLDDAGEGKEMLAAYDAAAETTRGRWAVRLALASGDHLYARGEVPAARGRYTAVAAADAGEHGDRARVRLAEIALADGKADECVRFCRQVLARDHEDRDAVLRLLGRGYERMNRPRAAAECFAGRLPTQ
jgi:tetratricopeptide (TPR) repeat protein